jgi:hypothetical protein
MDWLKFINLVATGLLACFEFGAFALNLPNLRRMPPLELVDATQGLVRASGGLVPILSSANLVLVGVYALRFQHRGFANASAWVAFFCLSVALVVSVWLIIPAYRLIIAWERTNPPPEWRRIWAQWEWAQGARVGFLLLGYVLFCLSVSAHAH